MTADKAYITVVSGIPRSGTSMMMRMLESGGMTVMADGLRKSDDDNPLGYYELEQVKRLDRDASWLCDAYDKAIKIIYILLYHLPPEHRYKILFLRRSLDEVIASQKAMLQHRSKEGRLSDDQLANAYHQQLQKLDRWLIHQVNIEVLNLHYEAILSKPEGAALDVAQFLNRPLNTNAMIQMVQPSLYRQRSTRAEKVSAAHSKAMLGG